MDQLRNLRHFMEYLIFSERKKTHPQATPDYSIDKTSGKQALSHYRTTHCAEGTSLPQLIIDITGIVRYDNKTGIQRVVRSVLFHWLIQPIVKIRIRPVYAKKPGHYYYAHRYINQFLDGSIDADTLDLPVQYNPGDIFFGLDFEQRLNIAQRYFYQKLQMMGIKTYFLVHDLLPILMPEHFPFLTKYVHSAWINIVSDANGIICVSKTVAQQVEQWIEKHKKSVVQQSKINVSYLGADIQTISTMGLPNNASHWFRLWRKSLSFLMVATIEPRKGHRQTLAAFEMLWKEGLAVHLIIVGKQGWMMNAFIKIIKEHPQYNHYLHYIPQASDEYLQHVYQASSCLIAASEGEGFGLPLIEAAQYGIPILARDLPVFREIIGDHAYYFNGLSAVALCRAIKEWISLYEKKEYPDSKKLAWLTWQQSSNNLLNLITEPLN